MGRVGPGEAEVGADLAIVGAIVASVDAEDRVLRPGSVAITGRRISAVCGPGEEPPRARRVIDGAGKLVLPGFVNVHCHTVLTGLRGRTEDAPAEVSLHRHLLPFRARMTPDNALALARLGALEAVRFGSTTVVDLYWHEEAIGEAFQQVGVRGVLGESVSEVDLLRVGDGIYEFDRAAGQRKLRAAERLFAAWHGRGGGRFRCIAAPHAPDDCSVELLREVQALARQYQVPITMHVAQSRSEVQRLRSWYGKGSIEFLADVGLLGPDLIASHCIFISQAEIPLLAESGTWIAYLPMINAKRGYAAPMPALRARGAQVAIGSDNMSGDMVMAARTGMIVARVVSGDSTLLPPREVLRLATIEGARALGLGDELGSIEVGKLADLVVVDLRKPHLWPLSDPVAAFFHWGLASDIDTVIVDGEIVVEGGRSTRVDQEQVLEAAQRAAESCWQPR